MVVVLIYLDKTTVFPFMCSVTIPTERLLLLFIRDCSNHNEFRDSSIREQKIYLVFQTKTKK